MPRQRVFVEGFDLWAPELPGWAVAREAFRGDRSVSPEAILRPEPALLTAAERRRAPETVLLALHVAGRTLERSGRRPDEVLSVFASANGDLQITDYMCSTLATAARMVSPIKFHNSVHNAPAGYWGIATGSTRASTSVSAFDRTFAAGLLEALTQCAAEESAVLLVGYDVSASGALVCANSSRGSLGVGLIFAPEATSRTWAMLDWTLARPATEPAALRSAAAKALRANAMADALPLYEALAAESPGAVPLSLGDGLGLTMQWTFVP